MLEHSRFCVFVDRLELVLEKDRESFFFSNGVERDRELQARREHHRQRRVKQHVDAVSSAEVSPSRLGQKRDLERGASALDRVGRLVKHGSAFGHLLSELERFVGVLLFVNGRDRVLWVVECLLGAFD